MYLQTKRYHDPAGSCSVLTQRGLSFRTMHMLPKVDLHRHLEGSLRLQTLTELVRTGTISLPANDTEQLRPLVQITNDPPHFRRFLDKFTVLRKFYHSPATIFRLTKEAIADAAADNVRYLELRFSPQALANERGFALAEVTDWVIEATRKASAEYAIQVNLIITLLRHESVQVAEQVAQIATDRQKQGIVGLDLAGDEVHFAPEPFAGIFREARQAGLNITVHAGEWAGANSVRRAIETLGAQRIGHGVRVIEDCDTMELVQEREITLEVCLTSNIQTGVAEGLSQHHLRTLLAFGVQATLNTDDPCVSDTVLSNEYQLALESRLVTYKQLRQMGVNAVQAAFLPASEKQQLLCEINNSWALV